MRWTSRTTGQAETMTGTVGQQGPILFAGLPLVSAAIVPFSSPVEAQGTGVCDPIPQVRDGIVEAVPDASSCEEVTAAAVSETTVTGTSHTISRLSRGTGYAVRAAATNPDRDGVAPAEASATADAQTSQQWVAPENGPVTGPTTVSGTGEVGAKSTASTWSVTGSDGLANATFSFQWLADGVGIGGKGCLG